LKSYRYRLDQDFIIPYFGYDFESEFVVIKDNTLTIKKGYAWDGCTPTRSFIGLFYIGIPNGHTDYRTGKPFCYYASLVHDALYQYEIGTRKKADGIFYLMLDEFPLSKVYYWAVRLCGKRWLGEKER